VTCADVSPGSIAVTFAGTTLNLESAYVSLSTHGLTGMGSFPDLPFYIPSSPPTLTPTRGDVSEEVISEGSKSSSSNNIAIIIIIIAIVLLCSITMLYFLFCRNKNEHQSNISFDHRQNSCIDLVESKRTIGESSYEAGDQNYKRDASGLRKIPQRQSQDSVPEIEGLSETSKEIGQVGESDHENLDKIIVPGSDHQPENTFVETKRSAHDQGDIQPGANREIQCLSNEDGAFI